MNATEQAVIDAALAWDDTPIGSDPGGVSKVCWNLQQAVAAYRAAAKQPTPTCRVTIHDRCPTCDGTGLEWDGTSIQNSPLCPACSGSGVAAGSPESPQP